MLGFRGSFLGFTYNNIHSSLLGITRTNGKDLASKRLSPDFQVETQDKTGADGLYYYGFTYKKRTFSVNFAFEEMTEEQLRLLQQKWNDKKIHELIFDEEPYKVYSAKITEMTTIKHIPFEIEKNGIGQRIYRGEGSVNFTCYYPFARSRYQYIEDYTIGNIPEWCSDRAQAEYDVLNTGNNPIAPINDYKMTFVESEQEAGILTESALGADGAILTNSDEDSPYININEWREASRIPTNKIFNKWQNNKLLLYNAGDLEMPFKVYFKLPNNIVDSINITLELSNDRKIVLQNLVAKAPISTLIPDMYIELDTNLGTIQGCNENFEYTGNLYNEYISDGGFFSLHVGECKLLCTQQPVKTDFRYLYL